MDVKWSLCELISLATGHYPNMTQRRSETGCMNSDTVEFEYCERPAKGFCLKLGYGIAAILTMISIWYLVALWGIHIRGVLFPTPIETLSRLFHLLSGGELYGKTIYDHFLASLVRWGTGFTIAATTGMMLGVLLGLSRTLSRILMPAVYVIQLIPGIAWIPIALLLFGLGETSTIFMITAASFAPIVINTCGGIQSAPGVYVQAAKMMGADRLTILFKVLLPASSLSIINGLRIGLANGWRVLIAAEMVVGMGIGLGYSIIQSRWSLDFEAAFVSIVLICLVGLFIEKMLFSVIEKRVSAHIT